MLQSLEHSSDEHLRDSLDIGRSFSLSGINIKSYCTDLKPIPGGEVKPPMQEVESEMIFSRDLMKYLRYASPNYSVYFFYIVSHLNGRLLIARFGSQGWSMNGVRKFCRAVNKQMWGNTTTGQSFRYDLRARRSRDSSGMKLNHGGHFDGCRHYQLSMP